MQYLKGTQYILCKIWYKLDITIKKVLSPRISSRIITFYKEYKDILNLSVGQANLPCTHNYILIEKQKDKNN